MRARALPENRPENQQGAANSKAQCKAQQEFGRTQPVTNVPIDVLLCLLVHRASSSPYTVQRRHHELGYVKTESSAQNSLKFWNTLIYCRGFPINRLHFDCLRKGHPFRIEE
jgi:hypothetical protein